MSDVPPLPTERWISAPCCWMCWQDREGQRRPPQMTGLAEQTCIFCGQATKAGIFVRVDLLALPVNARCAECGLEEPLDGRTLHDGQVRCVACSEGCSTEGCVEVSLRGQP